MRRFELERNWEQSSSMISAKANLFHAVSAKIDQFVLLQAFGVKICDQEADIIALQHRFDTDATTTMAP